MHVPTWGTIHDRPYISSFERRQHCYDLSNVNYMQKDIMVFFVCYIKDTSLFTMADKATFPHDLERVFAIVAFVFVFNWLYFRMVENKYQDAVWDVPARSGYYY